MPDAAWKKHERTTARRFGTERNGPTGTTGADADTATLAIECKYRKEFPLWLKDAVAQVVGAAGARQLPIVVLHEKGQRNRNKSDLVVLRLGDFEDWHGRVVVANEPAAEVE